MSHRLHLNSAIQVIMLRMQ